MRSPLRHRLLTLGAAVAATLALVQAAPATAGTASSARTSPAARAQASVVVPNVVGQNVGVAISVLQSAGFGLGFSQFTDNVCMYDPFEVVRQTPAAGSVVAPGSVVTVTFAVRPRPPAQCP